MSRVKKMLDLVEQEFCHALIQHEKRMKRFDIAPIAQKLCAFDEAAGCIVISFLRSSYVTGSHDFKMTVYQDEPFIERHPPHAYINLSALYGDVNVEVKQFLNKIERNYPRVMASEKKQIRNAYLERLYLSSVTLFESVVQSMQQEGDQQQTSDGAKAVPVFYGEDMGEIQLLGEVYPLGSCNNTLDKKGGSQ